MTAKGVDAEAITVAPYPISVDRAQKHQTSSMRCKLRGCHPRASRRMVDEDVKAAGYIG